MMEECINIYCSVTNYSKLGGFKKQTFIISQFMWIINPGVDYWGVSSSVSLMRLQSSCHPGLHWGESASMFPQEPFHSLSEWFFFSFSFQIRDFIFFR